MSCTFCDLIQGAAEVSVCYEDAEALAFMDIQPVNAGHVLVVPRAHYESLLDVPQDLGARLFKVTMRVANAVRRVSGCEGMNIVVNSGVAAGQDVFHYHVHIIPRRKGDGFDIELPFPGSEMPDRTVLDMMAARIVAAMQDPMRANAGGGGGGGDQPGQGQARRNAGPPPSHADRQEPAGEWWTGTAERSAGIAVHREPSAAPWASDEARDVAPAAHVRSLEGAHGELVREYDGAA